MVRSFERGESSLTSSIEGMSCFFFDKFLFSREFSLFCPRWCEMEVSFQKHSDSLSTELSSSKETKDIFPTDLFVIFWDKEITINQCTLFENHSKCRIWIFEFWHFPPIFVLLKLTCLVTLFDRKLQFFKNSPNWLFLAFLNSKCKRSSLRSQCWMRLFLWFSNTMRARMHSSILRLSIQIRSFFLFSVSSFLFLFCLLHHYPLMVHGWKQKKIQNEVMKIRSWKIRTAQRRLKGKKKIYRKKVLTFFQTFLFQVLI